MADLDIFGLNECASGVGVILREFACLRCREYVSVVK